MEKRKLEEIRKWVWDHREEIRRDLGSLVAARSVSRAGEEFKGMEEQPYGAGCAEALEKMLKLGERYGLEVLNYAGRCGSISLKKRGDKGPEIGIWTHLDVVEAGGGWSFPPYELSEKDGFWIGRGVQDNKGPAVGVLYALRYLKETKGTENHNYTLFVGCSEEKGMEDVEYFTAHEKPADFHLVADCVFPVGCGEKGILNLAFRRKLPKEHALKELRAGKSINSVPEYAEALLEISGEEYKRLKRQAEQSGRTDVLEVPGGVLVTAQGVSGHVGYPQNSENAIFNLAVFLKNARFVKTKEEEELLDFLVCLCGDFYGEGAGISCKDEVSGSLCGTLTVVEMKRGEVLMRADYRYPIFAGGSRKIKETLGAFAQACGAEMTVERDLAPYYIEPEHPNIRKMMEIYREAAGNPEAQPYTMSGGTYARKLPNAVAYGMSLENKKIYTAAGKKKAAGDCHQPDESVDIEQLLEGTAIYIATLLALD